VTRPSRAIIKVDRTQLPTKPQYLPIARRRWYGRRLPLAFVAGMGMFGALFVALSSLGSEIVWGAVFALYAAVFLRLRSRRRRIVRLLCDHDEGLALLAAGDLERAGALFEDLCQRARSMPPLHSLFLHHRGLVELLSGRHDRAKGMFLAVLTAGWLSTWTSTLANHHVRTLAALAMCEVLRGDLEAAIEWREQASSRTTPARRGSLLLVDALIAARRDSLERLVAVIDAGWERAENLLTASQLRVLRLLKAFALERTNRGRYRGSSSDAEIREALNGTRPFRAGEFDYLTPRWPELRDFLERHGFVDAAPGRVGTTNCAG